MSLFTLFVLVTVIIPMILNPARRPDNMVRNYLLNLTPLGTNISDVINIVEGRNDWDVRRIDHERGFTVTNFALPGGDPNRVIVVGEMSVRVHIGTTRLVWHAWPPLINWFVEAFWGFDESGNLIEIRVRRFGLL